LSDKINKEEVDLQRLKKELADAEGADQRYRDTRSLRKEAHKRLFQAIIDEEEELKALYQPLKENLSGRTGSLGKLTFEVRRTADVAAWAEKAEEILDLRKNGPFRGRGTLGKLAAEQLKAVWEQGSADEIANAMGAFITEYYAQMQEHCPYDHSQKTEYTAWQNQVAEWFYTTTHIKVSYSVMYDGVDIRQLSPGTRGIVLLLLYLAIDKEDTRPLIIDQPEENLDPKSIFDELVPLFREVKTRSQIIIVTHNANLVVNTDADQVIVASCGPHRPQQLPLIHYESGGIENPTIRGQVCAILEGGEAAFRERARRLRVGV